MCRKLRERGTWRSCSRRSLYGVCFAYVVVVLGQVSRGWLARVRFDFPV